MQKLPLSMFKSCKNVSNLAFFVHAKSCRLFGLCEAIQIKIKEYSTKGAITFNICVRAQLALSSTTTQGGCLSADAHKNHGQLSTT